ncbi:MAG: WG repeat-containing protein [Bryobacteraceae bacterium]
MPLKISGAWGYVDRQGAVKLKPQFKEASEFCNGYAVVKVGDKSGLIASSGQFTIQPIFEEVLMQNSENLVAVCMGECGWRSNNGRWGFADVRTGAIKIRPQFTSARPFTEHLAAVCTGGCNETYDDKTYTTTKATGKWGFIDPSGAQIISQQFDEAQNFYKGIAKVTLGSGDSAKSGYIDPRGAFVAGPSN